MKRALILNPDLAGAHLLKGNLLLRVARATDAVAEFNEYLRLEPNGPFAAETRALMDKINKAAAESSESRSLQDVRFLRLYFSCKPLSNLARGGVEGEGRAADE